MKYKFPAHSSNNRHDQLRFEGYPFERMKLGDYFDVSLEDIPRTKSHSSSMTQDSDRRFATRKFLDGSLRVMRIV